MFQLPWLGGYLRNSDQYSLGWRKGGFTTVTLQSMHACLPDSIDTQGAEKYCARTFTMFMAVFNDSPNLLGKETRSFPEFEPYAIATSRWMNEWSVWNYGNPKLTGWNAHVHAFSCIFMHVHSFSFIAPIEIANHCPQVGGKFTVKMDSSPAQLVPNSITVKSPLRQSPSPRCCRRRVAACVGIPGGKGPRFWIPADGCSRKQIFGTVMSGIFQYIHVQWMLTWRFGLAVGGLNGLEMTVLYHFYPTLPAEIVKLRQIDKMCPMVI